MPFFLHYELGMHCELHFEKKFKKIKITRNDEIWKQNGGFLVFSELYKMEKIWSSKIQKVQLL